MLNLERLRLKYLLNVKIVLWQSLTNVSLSKQLGGGQEKSEILSIPNKSKDTLEDLVDNSNVEHPALPRQKDLPSNDIPGSKDDPSDLEMDNDLSDKS